MAPGFADRTFLMKVTAEPGGRKRADNESYEAVNEARRLSFPPPRSLVISDILLQRATRQEKRGREAGAAASRRCAARPPRSIKASASAENFYMNGFHYVADLLRASSRAGINISPSQRVLLSSASHSGRGSILTSTNSAPGICETASFFFF